MTATSNRNSATSPDAQGWLMALGALALGAVLTTASVQTWIGSSSLASGFVSPETNRALLKACGARSVPGSDELWDVPWQPVFFAVMGAQGLTWGVGSLWCAWRNHQPLERAARRWGWFLGGMWCALGAWEPIHVLTALSGWSSLRSVIEAAAPLWVALAWAGGMTAWATACTERRNTEEDTPRSRHRECAALMTLVSVYFIVFVTMNWRLWFNLFIPHGDSAMYEEHLWNVLHGKGFRSYIDQGLFLGEHIQVVHLGLLPLYVLWPSHLLLELCESLALGMGAFPVAWMTHRHTQSSRLAVCAAAAYLLYFPLQFLDIEIDLKTFRPEAFGIPLLLLALDQLDRGRLWGMLGGLLACLTVKEDYAIIIAPLGLWIAANTWCDGGVSILPKLSPAEDRDQRRARARTWTVAGIGLMLFGVAYLWLTTRVVIPWFRPGEEVHYARYFTQLGDSPEAIIKTVLFRPKYVAELLITPSTVLYALAMLAPVGFVALKSAGRLAVGAPLFGVLCLNELARDPRHHFHAPLVAIVFWAVAAGLGHRLNKQHESVAASPVLDGNIVARYGTWLWASALCTGIFFSLSPLGVPFWDPGSTWNWHRLYGSTDRGEQFAKIAPLIPRTARVASTDFVHPRFTHHARSYDYSGYRRKVSGYEAHVPDDTDFIVIDTRHRYSQLHRPEDIPEYRDHPDQWELLPNDADGDFIVLKRRR